jgi:hypothetical protein
MRVICIEDSILVDKDKPDFGDIFAHKGSIYNVISSIQGEELKEKTGLNYASGVWYEFLESPGIYHHYIRFLEIPDYVEEQLEYMEKFNNLIPQ